MRGLKLWYIAMTRQELEVASFTDAWIETNRGTTTREIGKSHLLQMRGLKPALGAKIIGYNVASFTDAWIETGNIGADYTVYSSHLLQMRGLKLY